ncbi:PREDICTED: uncharacterized protein LOC104587759 [Nelumbo nucifera]|uniref:Uncharacterized protein LOC104587759 n=2 Tax=Nelumbo nucifera TaxID=4432 RepID=A0A1U7YTV5_NELNU|nr:PREDICTED: uncharacterized protein LOC104587759 [Nelumbo nucifera]DAD31972.1 TPA_asm: hypothetical protein HUJ06_010823 [Nelumbo nucifera]
MIGEIPTETKKDIWKLIKKKFKVNDDMKDYTMKSLGKKWRDWKSNLNKKYYDPDPDSVDALPIEQLENRVDAHQWRNLVQFWRSEKGTTRSITNKANHSKQTINHTAGAKSFARVHEELKIEREADVSRTDVFYATHRKKDGTLVDPRSGSLMEEMQNCMSQEEDTQNEGSEQGHDDVYAHVMGQERRGRVRGIGLGPNSVQVQGPMTKP